MTQIYDGKIKLQAFLNISQKYLDGQILSLSLWRSIHNQNPPNENPFHPVGNRLRDIQGPQIKPINPATMDAIKITTQIDDQGKMPDAAKATIAAVIRANVGKMVTFEIKPSTRKTEAQYAYLYGVVYQVAKVGFGEKTGEPFSDEEVDHFFKKQFWFDTVKSPMGGEERVPRRKRDMNRAELAAYTDNVIKWLRKWVDVEVPPPSDGPIYYESLS